MEEGFPTLNLPEITASTLLEIGIVAGGLTSYELDTKSD